MEVELDDALLQAQPCEELAILAICALGQAGRHRVVPQNQTAWDAWASTLPQDLRDQVKAVWGEGLRRSSQGTASEQIRVTTTLNPRFTQNPLELNPSEALTLLGSPLRVFLENGRFDRTFLLAFADPATRKSLEDSEQAGWLVFETAGGVAELAARALEAATHPVPREVFRTMYLCDSDARAPGVPEQTSAEVENSLNVLCQSYRRHPGHFGRVLSRRAAENYAPPGNVLAWAATQYGSGAPALIKEARQPAKRAQLALGTGNAGSHRRLLLAAVALRELNTPQSQDIVAHFDMKFGRYRNGNVRSIDALWNRLDDFQKAALNDGFGTSFSEVFYGSHRSLKDSSNELGPVMSQIVARI